MINSKPLCTEAIATSSSTEDRQYILHPIEAGPTSSTRGRTYTVLDPRLMFHGLPQLFLDRFPQLNEVRYQVKRNAGRYDVKYFPIGFTSIMKKEKVVLRDGTTYELTTTWTADPDFIVKRNIETQTDGATIDTDTQTDEDPQAEGLQDPRTIETQTETGPVRNKGVNCRIIISLSIPMTTCVISLLSRMFNTVCLNILVGW